MREWIAALAIVIAAPALAAEAIVTDGNTLILNGTVYRLDGIDAPDTDQVCLDEIGAVWRCGFAVRDQLKERVAKHSVRCEDRGRDTDTRRRRLGLCSVEGDSVPLNQWLVLEGLALNTRPDSPLQANQNDARDKRRGLWRGCFSPPQAFRRASRGNAVLLGANCPKGRSREVRGILSPGRPPAMPPGCTIKGKLATRAQLTGWRGIYHLQSCRSYARTPNPDRWFCSEDEAKAEGFRKSWTC